MSLQLITTVDSARVAQNQFVAFNAPTTSVDFFGLIGIKVCDSPSVIRMEKDNPRRASWIVHFPLSDDGLVFVDSIRCQSGICDHQKEKNVSHAGSRLPRFLALLDQFPKLAGFAELLILRHRQFAAEQEIPKRVLVQDAVDGDSYRRLCDLDML